MAKQTIDQGTAPTGAGGDTFRSGSAKLQANDDEIYNYLGDGTNLNKLGTAAFKNVGTQAGNVMGVGAFGLGITPSEVSDPFKNLSTSELRKPCFVSFKDVPLVGGNGIAVLLPSVNTYAVNCLMATDSGGLWHGKLVNSQHSADSRNISYGKLLSSNNTTIDGNGFVKAASPIIKLFANKIELNDEAQQQEIVFEKLGTGDYLITGSTGFAQEGWYVETPKDANGNVLFSVIYTSLENGDISVKTYKKKFDFETVSIVADLNSPVDIPVGRWIDIRLQELPQPELVPPVSNTPASFQPTGIAQAVSEMMNGTEQ